MRLNVNGGSQPATNGFVASAAAAPVPGLFLAVRILTVKQFAASDTGNLMVGPCHHSLSARPVCQKIFLAGFARYHTTSPNARMLPPSNFGYRRASAVQHIHLEFERKLPPLNNLSTVGTFIDTDGTSNEREAVAKEMPTRELHELALTIYMANSEKLSGCRQMIQANGALANALEILALLSSNMPADQPFLSSTKVTFW